MNVLVGRLGVIDTDGQICLRKRDDSEGTVVKVVSHGSVGWGKLCGQLPAFIAIEPRDAPLQSKSFLSSFTL